MTKQNNIIKELGYTIISRRTRRNIKAFFTLVGVLSTGVLSLAALNIKWLEMFKGLVLKLALTLAFAVIILGLYYIITNKERNEKGEIQK